MKATNLKNLPGVKAVCLPQPEKDITGVYCCDLLSLVMGKAPAGCAWVTVMGNVNAVAVASLAEIGAVIIAGGAAVDPVAVKKAQENGVNLFCCETPIFETARTLDRAL